MASLNSTPAKNNPLHFMGISYQSEKRVSRIVMFACFAFALLSVFVFPVGKALAWWDTSFSNRRTVTFGNASSSEVFTNFPALVLLNATNSSNIDYSKTQDLGQDIRFVDSDDTTALQYEIDRWDESATSSIWVKIPSLATGSADSIFMYYGSTSAVSTATTTGVWDGNFKLVTHFGSTNASATDSALNINHGTVTGAVATTTNSIAGYAKDYDGTNDIVTFGNDASVNDLTQNTISLWITPDVVNANQRLFDKQGGAANGTRINSSGTLNKTAIWTPSVGVWDTTATLTAGNLYHIGYAYDGSSTANDPIIYINGSSVSITEGGAPSGTLQSDSANIIRTGLDSASNQDFNGRMDEIRYSNTVRSASWILAEYKNGVDDFNTFGGEEVLPPDVRQIHYRWRNDDGNETGATYAALQDAQLSNMAKRSLIRLRIEVSNEGVATSSGERYRLEYGQLSTTCAAIGTWVPLVNTGSVSDQHWSLVNTSNIADGTVTTDSEELTNENTTFVAGEFRSVTNLTSTTTLSATQFTELEWALWAEQAAANGGVYCFRATNNGSTANFTFSVYAQASIRAGGGAGGGASVGGTAPAATPTTGGTQQGGGGATGGGSGSGGSTGGGTTQGGGGGSP